MEFSSGEKETLARASRLAVHETAPRLAEHWNTKSWLSDGNPYRNDVIQEIKRSKDSGNTLECSHLSEYIAASTIIHCFDGWSYLGRALEAEMAGDPDTARHLGYYAELRAAMSLLASEGVGVFHNIHIIVTERECIPFPGKSTHEFVWEALRTWADSPKSIDTVLKVIKPGSLPLKDWLDQFSGGTGFITSTWLQQWGLDLSRFADDREARNLASYRPTAFTSSGPEPIKETMNFILKFWEICDPETNGGFPILDKNLLRISLELIFKNKYKRTPRQAKRRYRREIQNMLENLHPSGQSKDMWTKFLNYETEKDTLQIISDAAAKDSPSHQRHSKQVLARAALLLRIATGCSRDLLGVTGVGVRNKLSFWLHSASVRRKMWPETYPPASFNDLWSDIDDAVSATNQWIKDNGESRDRHGFWTTCASEASVLSTAERAFLWGIGL